MAGGGVGSLRRRWAANFRLCEGALSLAATGLLVGLSEGPLGPHRLDLYLAANRYTVYGAAAAVCGALLGLVIAASALVLDRLAEGRLALVQRTRHIVVIPWIFRAAMFWLGLATLISLVGLVPTGRGVATRVIAYLWLLTGAFVVARLSRVIWIVGRLMTIVATQEAG